MTVSDLLADQRSGSPIWNVWPDMSDLVPCSAVIPQGHVHARNAEFASTLKQARRLGSVTNYLPGAGKLADSVQSANLQQYEVIIK